MKQEEVRATLILCGWNNLDSKGESWEWSVYREPRDYVAYFINPERYRIISELSHYSATANTIYKALENLHENNS